MRIVSDLANQFASQTKFQWAITILLLLIPFVVLSFASHDIATSDLLAYVSGTKAFYEGKNPYDGRVMNEIESMYNPTSEPPKMVWNPPILFVTYGIAWMLPIPLVFFVWRMLTLVAAVTTACVGWRLATKEPIVPLHAVGATVFTFPLWLEFSIYQISSCVFVAFALGLLFLNLKRDLISGALFSLSIIKPHIILFPSLCVAYFIVKEKRWTVLLSSVLTIATLLFIAEIVHPSILASWLLRESWPVVFLGSTISSLARAIVGQNFGFDMPSLTIGFFFVGMAFFFLLRRFFFITKLPELIVISSLLNPIFSPYGFVFDQVPLVCVNGYLVSKIAVTDLDVDRKRRLYIRLIICNLLPLCVCFIHLMDMPLTFYLFGPGLLIFSVMHWNLLHKGAD